MAWQSAQRQSFMWPCLHLWSRLLASLVSFRFVLEQWVNQSSYMHPCLQFPLIYEQGITQPNLRLICHLSLRCTSKVFSCYKSPLSHFAAAAAAAACGPALWSAEVEEEHRSLAGSPAACSSHRREGHQLQFFCCNCITIYTKDLVPVTAITHCYFSSLWVSMECLPFPKRSPRSFLPRAPLAHGSGWVLAGWNSHWRQTLVWLQDEARRTLN